MVNTKSSKSFSNSCFQTALSNQQMLQQMNGPLNSLAGKFNTISSGHLQTVLGNHQILQRMDNPPGMSEPRVGIVSFKDGHYYLDVSDTISYVILREQNMCQEMIGQQFSYQKKPKSKCVSIDFESYYGPLLEALLDIPPTPYILAKIDAIRAVIDTQLFEFLRDTWSGKFTSKKTADSKLMRTGSDHPICSAAYSFYQFTEKRPTQNISITAYRAVKLKEFDPTKPYAEPLPSSTTTSLSFAKSWCAGCDVGERAIIFEMQLSSDQPICCSSYPEGTPPELMIPPALNQTQFEIVIAPCVLTNFQLKEQTSTYDLYTCDVTMFSKEDYIEKAPELFDLIPFEYL